MSDEAVDSALTLLTSILADPSDAKLRVVPASFPGADLLIPAGFQRRGAFLALSSVDPLKIEAQRTSLSQRISQRPQKGPYKAMRAQAALVKPERGGTLLTILLPNRTLRRKFDADDTLSDVVRFLAAQEDTPEDYVDGLTWRLVESGPYYWCDAWCLEGERPFADSEGGKTLMGLGLWPSAKLKLTSVDFNEVQQQRVERTVKPSDLRKQVETRFDDTEGWSTRTHIRVPGLKQLMDMGFDEQDARVALRKASGDVQRAVGYL